LEKIRDFIFNDLGADYPNESPMGLVLFGDAGKDYISITRFEISLSKPAKAADEENHPAPQRAVSVDSKSMNPPAPNKKPVDESASAPAQPLNANANPTTASPNFEGTSPLNPTTTGKF
jgi:hypothetical protein